MAYLRIQLKAGELTLVLGRIVGYSDISAPAAQPGHSGPRVLSELPVTRPFGGLNRIKAELPMGEQDLCCEIVQSGKWLYDNSVPTDVWIVRQNFEYWYEPEFSDGPERLNENGELFQVLFVRGDRRTLGPAKFSLKDAVASAEELIAGQITWTNHLRQKLFGGRSYSLTPTE